MIISNLDELSSYLEGGPYDLIVVCGYDNVGKGLVLQHLKDNGYPVFHPDYSLICNQVNRSGRWSYFMYSLDILGSYKPSLSVTGKPLVCDRGALCGAVYNDDKDIALLYKHKLESLNVIHILVECDKDSYLKLIDVRGSSVVPSYEDYLVHTERYRSYLRLLGLDHIEYMNSYNEHIGNNSRQVCGGCTHYKSGFCTLHQRNVNYNDLRCGNSQDKEIQDD